MLISLSVILGAQNDFAEYYCLIVTTMITKRRKSVILHKTELVKQVALKHSLHERDILNSSSRFRHACKRYALSPLTSDWLEGACVEMQTRDLYFTIL